MQASDTERPDPGQPITVHQVAIALDCSTLNRVALDTAVGLAAATGAVATILAFGFVSAPFRDVSDGFSPGRRGRRASDAAHGCRACAWRDLVAG